MQDELDHTAPVVQAGDEKPWEAYQVKTAETRTADTEERPWEAYQVKEVKTDQQQPIAAHAPIAQSRLRQAFQNSDLAFVDDDNAKQAVYQAISLAADPDEETKKLIVAAHISQSDRSNVAFIYGNIDAAMEKYFGKKTSVDQAFQQIRESYTPQRDPAENTAVDSKGDVAWYERVGAVALAPAYGIANRIYQTILDHELKPDNLKFYEEKAKREHDSALSKSREKYRVDMAKLYNEAFHLSSPVSLFSPGDVRALDLRRPLFKNGAFAPQVNNLGIAIPPPEPQWSYTFGDRSDEVKDEQYMEYIRRFPEEYYYAKDAKNYHQVNQAYWSEVEKRYGEKYGQEALNRARFEVFRAERQIKVAQLCRDNAANTVYFQEGEQGVRERVRLASIELRKAIDENSAKYHSGETLGEQFRSGDFFGMIGEGLAICYDQFSYSIAPMAVEAGVTNLVAPGTAIPKMLSVAWFWNDMAAEGKLQYLERHPNATVGEINDYAQLHALAEVVPEYLFGIFKVFFGDVTKALEKGFWRGAGDVAKGFVKQGASDAFGEFITHCAEKIQDAEAGIGTPGGKTINEMSKEEFKEFFWQGLPEVLVSSFITAGASESVSRTVSYFNQHVQREKMRSEITARVAELETKEQRTETENIELGLLRDAANTEDVQKTATALIVSKVIQRERGVDGDRENLSPEARSEQALLNQRAKKQIDTTFNPDDTVAEVERVKDLLRLNDRARIQAVENFDALPDAVKRDIEEKGYRAEGIDAYFYDGKCYLIADRVNPARVFQRVMHEYFTHAGLRVAMNQADYEDFMDEIFLAHKEEIAESPWAENYGFKADPYEDFDPEYRDMDRNDPRFAEYAAKFENELKNKNRELAEEWLAREAEKMAAEMRRGIESQELGRWRKFLARIRKWLAEHHLLPKSYLDRLDDRVLTDMLCHITEKAGHPLADGDENYQAWSGDGRAAAGGDVGARNLGRGQDLETAKLMHDFGKEMHAIKLATGFELSDGEWKLEIPDLKIKTQNAMEPYFFFQGPLEDYIDAPEIFKAYPQLKKMPLLIGDTGEADAYYTSTYKRIVMNSENQMDAANRCYSIKDKGSEQQYKQAVVNYYRNLRSILIHEVQHAIQDIEGFAPGGSLERAEVYKNQRIPELNEKIRVAGNKVEALRGREDVKQYEAALADRMKKFSAEVTEGMKNNTPRSEVLDHHWEELDKIRERYPVFEELQAAQNELNRLITDRSLLLKDDDYGIYSRFAGEVESRNMQRRADMSEEERRQSLFDDTADTVPGSRIYLDGERGGESMALPDDKVDFEKILDEYQKGILNPRKPVTVTSETPAVYLRLNMSNKGIRVFNRKITMPYSVIDKAVGKIASTTTEDFHNVSLDELKNLPDSLYNPVMVLHGNRDGTIEIYTQIFDNSHRPVMVVLEINMEESPSTKKKSGKDHTYTVNSIRSIYGKDNANTAINKVKKGDFWYFNKKLAEEWCRAAGVQFPGAGDITLRLPYTIIDPGKNSTWIGEKNAKKSGRGDVDMASQLDPALEDQMVEALLAPVKSAAGDLAKLLEGDALKYLTANGFPDVGNQVARYLVIEARERLAAIKRKESRRAAFQNYRQMDQLFDFICEFCGKEENLIVNPGEKYVDAEVSGSFISPEWKKYTVKRPQGKRESDASYRKYLAKREAALAHAEGMHLDEIARAYVDRFGGDEAEIEQKMYDLLKNLTKKEIVGIYATYKQDQRDYERKLNDEAEAEYAEFLENEIGKIFESEGEVTKEQLLENRDLAKMLYAKVFGKKLEGEITNGEIAAINAVIKRQGAAQEGASDADLQPSSAKATEGESSAVAEDSGGARDQNGVSFAEAYLAAREEIIAEYRKKWQDFKEKYIKGEQEKRQAKDAAAREDKKDLVARENAARDLVFSAMPPEMRARYLAKILAVTKLSNVPSEEYPNGHRTEAFDALMQEIAEEGRAGRAREYVKRFDARVKQLHLTVDQSRKLVGTRTEEYQKILDEIAEIRQMSIADVNAEKVKLADEIDALPDRSEGDGVLPEVEAAQKRLALLEEFGDLESKDADAVKKALDDLNTYAKTGRLALLDKIAERRAKDEALRNFIIGRVTSGKGVKTGQAAWDATVAARENPPKLANYAYGLLKLEDFFYLLSTNGEKGDWLENPLGKIFQHVHTSAVEEATRGRKFADWRNELLNEVLGAKTAVGRAAKLQKYRERVEHTGIFRFDAGDRKVTYDYIPVADAKALLAKYDRGESVPYNEFQMEYLRDAIKAGDLKIERSFKPAEEDKVTETVAGAVARDVKENLKAEKVEPTVGIPTVEFKGSYEMQNLNQLEMLDLYLAMRQRDVRYKMWANGYTEESFKQIEKALAPEMKVLGEKMVEFLEKQGAELDAIQKELFFAGIDSIENYFPMLYESRSVTGSKVAPALDDPDAARKAPARLAPGSLKVRNAHLLEPRIGDALVVFENAVRRSRHYLAFAEVARDLRGVLLNPDVKKACDQTFGTGFFKNLRNAVVDTINGGNANAEYHALYQAMYGNAVSMKMMFNLLSGIKQMMSGFAYANDMPVDEFAKNLFAVWIHPEGMLKTLRESDYLKNRFFGGSDAHAALVFDAKNKYVADSRKFEKLSKKLKIPASQLAATSQAIACLRDWGGIFTRLGDATPCLLFGAALYRYHYNRMIDQGFTPAEAKKHALVRWEMATESLQQSAAVHNQNAVQRSALMKPFTAWKSSQTLLGQRFWRELLAKKIFGKRNVENVETARSGEYTGAETSGRGATAAKALLVDFVISALIASCGKAWYDISARNKKKKKEEEEESNPIADYALDALVSGTSDLFDIDPFAGSTVDYLYNISQGKAFSQTTDKSIFGDDYLKAAAKTYQAAKALNSDKPQRQNEKSPEEKVYDAAAADLKAMGVLSPTFQVTGSLLSQSKRWYDLWAGGERDLPPAKPETKTKTKPKKRRKKRVY